MKGLLIKDFLTVSKQLKVIAVLMAFYIVYSLTMQDVSMLGIMIILLTVMLPITAMAYDERSGWRRYESALPISKKTIVFSKYIFGFILLALGGAIACLCLVALSTFSQGIELTDGLSMIGGYVVAGTVFISIIFPFLFQFGVEKARMLMMLVFFLPAMIVMLLSRMQMPLPDHETVVSWISLIPILLPLLVAGSIVLSTRIYHRKEF